MTTFRWAGTSHQGQVRSNNQDSWHAADGVFIVADGMGGHRGGEVASAIAIDAVRGAVTGDADTTSGLLAGIHAANDAILAEGDRRPELRGMGTTVCAVAAVDPPDGRDGLWLAVANVGDSRVYLWAGGELRQITQDHSLVEDMVRQGRLSSDEALAHPQRNILTRALGVADDVEIDYWEMPGRAGDRYVLCSDGLFNEVDEHGIAAVLRRLAEPSDIAQELVRLANVGGGRDNITVVVADVVDAAGSPTVATDERTIGDPRVHVAGLASASGPDTRPVDEVAPFAAPGLDDDPVGDLDDDIDDDPTRARGLFGVLAWATAAVVVILVAMVAVGLYARSSYFVDVADDRVAIFQGRPGGVLWFDPTLEELTDIEAGDLTPQLLEEVGHNPDYASLDGARDYVAGLAERIPGSSSDPEPDDDAEPNEPGTGDDPDEEGGGSDTDVDGSTSGPVSSADTDVETPAGE